MPVVPIRAARLSGAGSAVRSVPPSVVAVLAIGAILVAALYFGRGVFVPLALAILLSFALAPLVLLLRRWRLNRFMSVLATVVIAFFIIAGLGVLIGTQIGQLAAELPQYQINVVQKIHSLRGEAGANGAVGRAAAMLKSLGDEMTNPDSAQTPAAEPATKSSTPRTAAARASGPTLVEIRQPEPTPVQIVESVIGPLLEPLAKAGIVVIVVIFVLLQREDLRDRFIRLAGARDLHRTTKALDDAAIRISRYLLLQTAINACFGVLVGSGLWLIGVPNPVLCGILAMLLRFAPFIGVTIAAAFPAAFAIAVDPGWSMLFWALGLIVGLELIVGQVVEPRLYGKSTGLSPIAVVIAAVFWTSLWGPVGLLLSTPITMCLVVVGRHVEHLRFLEVLLGDQPPLALEESFYQRMLAEDPDEAARQAEEFLKDMPLSTYYDQVAIRGLALAQSDVNRGVLDHEQRVKIKAAVDGVIDNLSDHHDAPISATADPATADTDPLPTAAPGWREGSIVCVAGRGSLDEAAADMLVDLLAKRGIVARVVSTGVVSAANLPLFDARGVEMACLSYLEPGSLMNARYLVRRLRRKLPGAKIMIGFWTLNREDVDRLAVLRTTEADLIVVSLRQAVERVEAGDDARQAG